MAEENKSDARLIAVVPRSAEQPGPTVRTQVELSGLGGERGVHLIVQPRFENPEDPRNNVPLQGDAARYKVALVLSRPGTPPLPEGELSFNTEGDSYLRVAGNDATKPGPRLKFAAFLGKERIPIELFGFVNDKGRLGRIEGEIEAGSFSEAEVLVNYAAAPMLSSLSVTLDVPIHVDHIRSERLGVGLMRLAYVTPFTYRKLQRAEQWIGVSAAFAAYASLYHEGLSSNSVFYRFLCFYKIIEGIDGRRRRLKREARKNGGRYTDPQGETVPDGDFANWLHSLFPTPPKLGPDHLETMFPHEARGRPFYEVVGKHLRPLRARVAHFLTSEGEPLAAHDLRDVSAVQRWLPLTRLIVRRSLRNEFPEDFKNVEKSPF